MKPRCLAFLALLAVALPVDAAETGIQFSGVLTADGKTRIALTDTASKTTTWVEPGAVFNGYTLNRYDAKEDAIFLRKSGEENRLGLIPSKTPDVARVTPAPATTPTRTAATAPAGAANSPPAAASPATADPPNVASTTPAPATPAPLPTAAAAAPAQPSAATSPNSVPATDSPAPATATAVAAAPPLDPPPTPTGRLSTTASYRVQAGDTVESIALTHGVSTQQIRQLNPSLNSTSLRTGDAIRIRPE